jgi:hypothetical protein
MDWTTMLRVAVVFTASTLVGCENGWQAAEAVDDRPHTGTQDPQPATAIAGTRPVVVWNRRIGDGGPSTISRTWARVFDATAWGAYTELGSSTARPIVAGSADGSAIALVTDGAFRLSGGTWSGPTSHDFGSDPAIAMDAAGRALVVGAIDSETRARFFIPASGWSASTSIGAGGSSYVVDMSENGAAVVAWFQGSEVWANVYGLDGVWSGAELVFENALEAGGSGIVFGPTAVDAGISAAGHAYVVASSSLGVRVAHHTPGSGFDAGLVLSADPSSEFPQIAVNSAGNALAAWTLSSPYPLQARYLRPGVGWSGAFDVSATSSFNRKGILLDDAGTAQLVYVIGSALGSSVFANEFDTTTLSFGSQKSLESLSGASYYLSATGAANGYGVAAWNAGGGSLSSSEQIWSARFVP